MEALRASPLTTSQLAKETGVDYHAVYRMRRDGVTYRGKNALALCKFFKIGEEVATVSVSDLTAAVVYAWDGTPEHGRLLIELMRCAERFRITQKAPNEGQ